MLIIFYIWMVHLYISVIDYILFYGDPVTVILHWSNEYIN